MMSVQYVVKATAVALALIMALPAAAQDKKPTQTAVTPTNAPKTAHRLVLQVNGNDPAIMNLALNNAANVAQYYQDKGEKVDIEIVTFGPGLHMLRADTSPVKDRIKSMSERIPSLSFMACGNTQANMTKAESKDVPLLTEAKVVPSGVVRVMELQEQGWSYVRP
ncbi:MAG TPA: DsrE family protein [Vineibacter sp.]|nr:DsrE family protein [Vineibacter sp.]